MPVRIPVQVQILPAGEGNTRTSEFGSLFNVSRGGAGLTVSWIVPPRTRFAVLIPSAKADLRLTAEVVWTSLTSGLDPESAVYGLRWVEDLSGESFEAMLPAGAKGQPDTKPSAPDD